MRNTITLILEDDKSQCVLLGEKEPVSYLSYEQAKKYIVDNDLRFDHRAPAGFEVWSSRN